METVVKNSKEQSNLNGILIVDKPKNLTSRDVVNRVSKILKTKKIGHTGTLDPMATGVLVLTIGKCTKLTDMLISKNKTYEVEMILGYETDTLDITGTTLNKSNKIPTEEEIINIIKKYETTYMQEVPAYSAVKVNGKKLYEYARNNIEIELPKKEVTIYNISDISINNKIIHFTCDVSKGTYIRGLIRDIGRELGTYATMNFLRRTRQGDYRVEDSYTLEEIENSNYKIINIDDILKDVYKIDIDDNTQKKVINGSIMNLDYEHDYIAFYHNNKIVALYKKDIDKKFKMYVKF